MSTEVFKQTAVRNAISRINSERRFPCQVFVGDWTDYLFFHPEILFEAHFVDVKNVLLKEENASVIAVVNLGNANSNAEEEPRAIFLDRDTTPNDYIAGLMGDGSAMSWMFLMDRYVFASDKGHWSIYCEKENDVAVLAVGEAVSRFTRLQLGKLLNARSIRSVPMPGNGPLFDFQKLVPEWKSALTAEYRPSDRPV
jgi:hypothetical protein